MSIQWRTLGIAAIHVAKRAIKSIQSSYFTHYDDIRSIILDNLCERSILCVQLGREILVLTVRAERVGRDWIFHKARCLADRLHYQPYRSHRSRARRPWLRCGKVFFFEREQQHDSTAYVSNHFSDSINSQSSPDATATAGFDRGNLRRGLLPIEGGIG